MENIFDPADLESLITRLQSVTPDSQRAWGTMTPSQMLVHCRKAIETAIGREKLKSNFLLRLFGRMMKKKMLAAPRFSKNAPTAPQYKVNAEEAASFQEEMQRLLEVVRLFEKGPDVIPNKTHPVFGRMTEDEWGRLHYMHLDHHLRQFGA